MIRLLRLLILITSVCLLTMLTLPAYADPTEPSDPESPLGPVVPLLEPEPIAPISDCKESPVPESPGQGIAGFFDRPPNPLPKDADPFAPGATTTIYEQYGYAGLRYRTYDLGCGPDAMRSPDAVIGTALSNWLMQPAHALAALTGSLTNASFRPTFLEGFDPTIERVSDALHQGLFRSWIPAALAAFGALLIVSSRRSALSSTAGAIGWALIVLVLATGLFRWPVEAGAVADQTVSSTIGTAVGQIDGDENGTDPGTAVNSNVNESILYRSWLAGTFGNPDSRAARRYGSDLFKAQALTWSQAEFIQRDPSNGAKIIEGKARDWADVTERIKTTDPEAYENLTGRRSETRVGYAFVSALGVFLALPFLLLAALLMLGCFLIVRLAVMVFPVFAVLGIFPATRGLITGLGRTVAAAVVNAIIFGIGAGITVAVLGILFNPGNGAPAWLSLVLMPLFTVVMWVALKPFRRLTTMVRPDDRHFAAMGSPMAGSGRTGRRWARRLGTAAISAASGGAGAAATTALMKDDQDEEDPPERAESRPSPEPSVPRQLPAAPARVDPHSPQRCEASRAPGPQPTSPDSRVSSPPSPSTAKVGINTPRHRAEPPRALPEGFVPRPHADAVPPPPPAESEWYDGEEVYTIYRPDNQSDDDAA